LGSSYKTQSIFIFPFYLFDYYQRAKSNFSYIDFSGHPLGFIDISREVEVANALKDIGGVRKRDCMVKDVGDHVNIWIIRNHDKYKNMTAKELGACYVGFYTDSKK
jgi:hypothetical protein